MRYVQSPPPETGKWQVSLMVETSSGGAARVRDLRVTRWNNDGGRRVGQTIQRACRKSPAGPFSITSYDVSRWPAVPYQPASRTIPIRQSRVLNWWAELAKRQN